MKTTKTFLLSCLILIGLFTKAQVGIGTNTPEASAKLDVTSTTKGFLPPRMDSTARNAITSPAAGLTIYNTSTNAFECYNGTSWYSTVHYVGENYGGGIVFYIYDNGQHGLIAATTDQNFGTQWYNGVNKLTGTTGDGLGVGIMNTPLIIAAQIADNQTGAFAARTCANYSVSNNGVNYGDWYLPSKFELNLLYLQKNLVGSFATDDVYFSSTEVDSTNVWVQSFLNGAATSGLKNITTGYVRAIRAF